MSGTVTSMVKPLHVQVAEALGWVGCEPWPEHDPLWTGVVPSERNRVRELIPRYDEDWSATGPLIQKYRIDVDAHPVGNWTAQAEPYTEAGHTPLEAVCNLILALAAAGKLPIDTRGPEAVTSGASHGS